MSKQQLIECIKDLMNRQEMAPEIRSFWISFALSAFVAEHKATLTEAQAKSLKRAMPWRAIDREAAYSQLGEVLGALSGEV